MTRVKMPSSRAVEQRDLAAVMQLRLQLASADAFDLVCHVHASLDAQSLAAGFR